MGPGPSDVHPRVLRALSAPTLGHLDPHFLGYMDDIQALLKALFGTTEGLAFPVSGTGSAGMEACMVNVLSPGDRVVIGVAGVFGGRMAEVARRLGCEVVTVEVPWGEAVGLEAMSAAIEAGPTRLVGIVHAETSTGVWQELTGLADAAHRAGALLMADVVTSLGGVPVEFDAHGIDLAYAGTQKCLSCPPGLAPVCLSPRARAAIEGRERPCVSWYLDMRMLLSYWGSERVYHHTAPVNMLYALREALRLVFEEGTAAVHARHLLHHRALVAGLEAMGLSMAVPESRRLPQLNAVVVPDGVEDAPLRRRLLDTCDLENGGGLGVLKGKVWRIGLMGHGARRDNVLRLLSALELELGPTPAKIVRGAALEAAAAVWDGAPG